MQQNLATNLCKLEVEVYQTNTTGVRGHSEHDGFRVQFLGIWCAANQGTHFDFESSQRPLCDWDILLVLMTCLHKDTKQRVICQLQPIFQAKSRSLPQRRVSPISTSEEDIVYCTSPWQAGAPSKTKNPVIVTISTREEDRRPQRTELKHTFTSFPP